MIFFSSYCNLKDLHKPDSLNGYKVYRCGLNVFHDKSYRIVNKQDFEKYYIHNAKKIRQFFLVQSTH